MSEYPLDIDMLRLFVKAMAVDGDVAQSELEKLRAFTNALGWEKAIIDQTIEEEVGNPTDLAILADAITDPEKQENSITVCASIVAADGKFEDEERGFIIDLCAAWGFEAEGLIEGIEQALANP